MVFIARTTIKESIAVDLATEEPMRRRRNPPLVSSPSELISIDPIGLRVAEGNGRGVAGMTGRAPGGTWLRRRKVISVFDLRVKVSDASER